MTEALDQARILIVEDELIVARDTERQLLAMGYACVGQASRGEEAIALVARLLPDLVLMDIQLPGEMDGIAAAQLIRARWQLPVVFLTAFDADVVLARAQLAEPYGYILKPFSERDLRTVLQMALYKSKAEARLREAALHTQAILDSMPDGVLTVNTQGLIESFNPAACSIFGYSLHEVLGLPVTMLMPESVRHLHELHISKYHSSDSPNCVGVERQVKGLRKNGAEFPLSMSISEIRRGEHFTFLGLAHDLSQQRKNEEEIHRLAYYDALTQLPNRRLLMDQVEKSMDSSARNGCHAALLLLDLDQFKNVNETLGLEMGDLLLQQVALRLKASGSAQNCVARTGGDEYAVLMDDLEGTVEQVVFQVQGFANQLLLNLSQAYTLHESVGVTTYSIGIVVFQGAGQSPQELLKKAGIALIHAKTAGRNTLRFFDAAMQAEVFAHVQRVADLRRGVTQQEFVLHFQIQVDRVGRPTGAEALVRWQHGRLGLVPPVEFIELAEETKLILPLGQWVLEQACRQLLAWAKDAQTAQWTMAVNVSAMQFAQADFVGHVKSALTETGANPTLLKLELTESMLVKDVSSVITKMHALKALGVKFSLDDFGTGYSSLSYLKRLPLDQLKIDKSFVRDLLTDVNDAAIARAIVALGHTLGLKVIAEGVETREQHEMLVAIDCDSFQGYYFGRPSAHGALIAGHNCLSQSSQSCCPRKP
jgi:diguanylate cyclase (GGDEF)-like protein/PAS domain S-box-containing protein